MSTLNVMCSICNEFYTSNDVIYCTTSCGHIFHQQCIMRWLAQSPTCPQCRANCHRRGIHRIYMNYRERTEDDDIPIVPDPIQWIYLDLDGPSASLNIPEGAIKVGSDPEGNSTYVARAYYSEDLLPANYVPEKKGAYAPYACQERFVNDGIQVLVNADHKWIEARDGFVPTGAIPTGYTEIGETLYTGRAQYRGITLLGKVHPTHKVLYMPYQGQEVNVVEYEVLVHVPKSETKP